MKTRILAALVMAPAAIGALWFLPTPWLAALFALVCLLGLWEWFRLSGLEGWRSNGAVVLNLLLMLLLVWSAAGQPILLYLALLVGVCFWVVALLWLRFSQFGSNNSSRLAYYCKRLAATLAVIPAWAALILLHASEPHGTLWLLTALSLVWAADSGAYFAGKYLGKHKLAPSISPNKTLEGVAGGVIAGVGIALCLGWIIGVRGPHLGALALVALISVLASILGDLFESLLKRQAGYKDSGSLIPGHGGVLDRIDGVLPALPIFALGKDIFGF